MKKKKKDEINFSDIYPAQREERTLVTVALQSGDKRRVV